MFHHFHYFNFFCSADWEVEKAAEDALLETEAVQDEVRKAKKVFQIYKTDVVF